MDLVGPFEVESYGVAKYVLVIVDAYPISRKSSVSDAVRSWAAEIKSDPRAKAQKLWIQTVRTDRVGEFLSNEFQSFCQEHNIKHTVTAPYTPEQNGMAERANRTLIANVRSMRLAGNMPKELWGELAYTAAYLHNVVPTSWQRPRGTPPHELMWGERADISHPCVVGCRAYVGINTHTHSWTTRRGQVFWWATARTTPSAIACSTWTTA
jgi:hypothetical protein